MSSMTYNETLIRLADNDIGVTATSDVPEPIQETKTTTYNKVSGQFASGSDNASNYKYIYALQTYVPSEDIILTSYGICDGHGSQTTDPMQGGYVFVKDDPNLSNYSNGKMKLLLTPSQVELTNAGTSQKLDSAYYHLYTLKKPIILHKGKLYLFPATGNMSNQAKTDGASEENIITYSKKTFNRNRICYCSNKEVINPAKLAMRKDADGEWIVNDTGYTKFSKSGSGPTVLQFNGTSTDDGVFV